VTTLCDVDRRFDLGSRVGGSMSGATPREVPSDGSSSDEVLLGPDGLIAPTPPAAWVPPTWDEVVQEHSGRVYRLAYRLTGNVHDAEDRLHRITTNLFLDQVRRKKRIRFDALADDAHERMPGREPDPSRAYEDTHLDDDVQAALDALSPEFRAAVVLCDIEQLTYEEVAATLGVKLGTVRSRIHRGRAQLRTALAHRRRPVAGLGAPDGSGASDGEATR
jgi:DNA-directed RNA polymerase specialized sigma24 family protein